MSKRLHADEQLTDNLTPLLTLCHSPVQIVHKSISFQNCFVVFETHQQLCILSYDLVLAPLYHCQLLV